LFFFILTDVFQTTKLSLFFCIQVQLQYPLPNILFSIILARQEELRQQQLQQALQESGQFLDEPLALPGVAGDDVNVAPLDTKMLQAAAAAVAALVGADDTAPLDSSATDLCVSYICTDLCPVSLFLPRDFCLPREFLLEQGENCWRCQRWRQQTSRSASRRHSFVVVAVFFIGRGQVAIAARRPSAQASAASVDEVSHASVGLLCICL
jgi:hypothetical protein